MAKKIYKALKKRGFGETPAVLIAASAEAIGILAASAAFIAASMFTYVCLWIIIG